MRILVVDDDQRLLGTIRRGLSEAAYAVDTAIDGEEGLSYADTGVYDLMIFDIMMPKKDGIALLREIRSKGMTTPVLMLTAKDAVEDIVTGLDAGADDYLVKPFSFGELLARTRSLLRRATPNKSTLITCGDVSLDTSSHEVTSNGTRLELTAKEYMLLEYFMRHPGTVITRTMLEEHAWDETCDTASNVIDVLIGRLRRKLDHPGKESCIQTIRGIGYKMRTA